LLIAGWHKTSLVDYPGKIATVLFTQGCNMRCSYCHNPSLWETLHTGDPILEETVWAYLEQRRAFLDGVVLTGGEPTLQEGLEAFLNRVKSMGLLVKLDTNGTKPLLLQKLISNGSVDFVAMDVKAPFGKYRAMGGVDWDEGEIHKSLCILRRGGVAQEFRTTLEKGLSMEDLEKIFKMVDGGKWVLQKCRGQEAILTYEALTKKFPDASFRGFDER
jgi:pyruvate formate lyase activating enzyme